MSRRYNRGWRDGFSGKRTYSQGYRQGKKAASGLATVLLIIFALFVLKGCS